MVPPPLPTIDFIGQSLQNVTTLLFVSFFTSAHIFKKLSFVSSYHLLEKQQQAEILNMYTYLISSVVSVSSFQEKNVQVPLFKKCSPSSFSYSPYVHHHHHQIVLKFALTLHLSSLFSLIRDSSRSGSSIIFFP